MIRFFLILIGSLIIYLPLSFWAAGYNHKNNRSFLIALGVCMVVQVIVGCTIAFFALYTNYASEIVVVGALGWTFTIDTVYKIYQAINRKDHYVDLKKSDTVTFNGIEYKRV